jgi:hypothetical protein
MIPVLPIRAVRQALDAGEWDRASALLADHERAVRDAVAAAPPDSASRGHWLALLQAQRELMEQLQAARGNAGSALQRLRQSHRGAAAYKTAGG